jgi:hypothetical protein
MSERHPIIAITGSSGAGTSTVTRTFENIFRRENLKAAVIEGDSFHRLDRKAMKQRMAEEEAKGNNHFSHFGAEGNLFPEIEACSASTPPTAPASAANTCTTPKKRRPTSRSPEPSPRGKTFPPEPTCCSTKACTAR